MASTNKETPLQEARTKRVMIVAYLILQPAGTLLSSYISTFAVSLQSDLDTNASMIGLLQSVPLFLCFPITVIGSVLFDIVGFPRILLLLGTSFVLSMLLSIGGYIAKSAILLLVGQCFVIPSNFMLDISYMVLLKTRLKSSDYSSLNGWACLAGASGLLLNQFVLVLFPQTVVLCVDAVAAVIVMTGAFLSSAALNVDQAASKKVAAKQTEKEDLEASASQDTNGISVGAHVFQALAANFGPKSLQAMPLKTWVMILLSSLNSGFRAFIAYGPFGLQRDLGVSEIEANRLVSIACICMAVISPFSGRIFGSYKNLRAPLFVFGAVLCVAGGILQEVTPAAWNATVWVSEGVAWTILKTGTVGLLPETLQDREDLIPTAITLMTCIGLLTRMVFIQIVFSIGIHMYDWDMTVTFTHPRIFWNAASVFTLVVSIWLCILPQAAPVENHCPSENTDAEVTDSCSSDEESPAVPMRTQLTMAMSRTATAAV